LNAQGGGRALLKDMANAIRALTMDAVERSGSGHPGMPMGMADVATVLFSQFITIDPSAPEWPDRDRFVLSAGHGSMLQYALHHLIGYADMSRAELMRFRQLGSRTAGHPEYGHAAGIEMTTGPLGQGLATAVGMAIAERLMNARFGDDLVSHYTYVIAGDGCLMEGISHEAIDLAGHLQLGKLVVLWDDNEISIDGPTGLTTSMQQLERFGAAGWQTIAIDGHDTAAIALAITSARRDPRPSLIACRTMIGYGAPSKQGTAAAHGSPLGAAEVAAARSALGWSAKPFETPEDILGSWSIVGWRGAAARDAWEERLARHDLRQAFVEALSGDLPEELSGSILRHKEKLSADAPPMATRIASQRTLEVIHAAVPNLVGGSADLTGSNNTKTTGMKPVSKGAFGGSYLHYGVREHGMAAAMNGIALHGGFIPYGGTFLAFADYARPAMRLSALMGLRVIYVMTHDSIGLGEDGPTHQPVEHLASLRAMPNLAVFRPADAVETAEAWAAALGLEHTPSVLCLTRQNLPTLRTVHTDENRTARGAYVLRETIGPRDVTILATGSEVEIAIRAADLLLMKRIQAAVVSMPSWELFELQPASYRNAVLGLAPRVAVEAALAFGWERWIGADGAFVGMDGFGASAPASDLYQKFGITPENVVATAIKLMDS
jgi:transketolase